MRIAPPCACIRCKRCRPAQQTARTCTQSCRPLRTGSLDLFPPHHTFFPPRCLRVSTLCYSTRPVACPWTSKTTPLTCLLHAPCLFIMYNMCYPARPAAWPQDNPPAPLPHPALFPLPPPLPPCLTLPFSLLLPPCLRVFTLCYPARPVACPWTSRTTPLPCRTMSQPPLMWTPAGGQAPLGEPGTCDCATMSHHHTQPSTRHDLDVVTMVVLIPHGFQQRQVGSVIDGGGNRGTAAA